MNEHQPMQTNKPNAPLPTEVRMLDYMSHLMDSRFRIPGTQIRFGLDAVIGLVPGLGDIVSFAMGSALIIGMVRHGASVRMVLKMLWNLAVDTLIGLFPVLGDIFDVWFKSNRRNYRIFTEYVKQNKKPRSIWQVLLVVIGGIIGILILFLYLVFFWLPGQIWSAN